MARLIAIALAVGMESKSIIDVLNVLAGRYRVILNSDFKCEVVHALLHKDASVIQKLGA